MVFTEQRRKLRVPKRPDPKASVVAVKLYHLPAESLNPCFTKANHHLAMKHFDSRYGKNYFLHANPKNLKKNQKKQFAKIGVQKNVN